MTQGFAGPGAESAALPRLIHGAGACPSPTLPDLLRERQKRLPGLTPAQAKPSPGPARPTETGARDVGALPFPSLPAVGQGQMLLSPCQCKPSDFCISALSLPVCTTGSEPCRLELSADLPQVPTPPPCPPRRAPTRSPSLSCSQARFRPRSSSLCSRRRSRRLRIRSCTHSTWLWARVGLWARNPPCSRPQPHGHCGQTGRTCPVPPPPPCPAVCVPGPSPGSGPADGTRGAA